MTFVAGTVLTAAALNSELAAKANSANPNLSGFVTVSSANSYQPQVIIQGTANDGNAAFQKFQRSRAGGAVQDNDIVAQVNFLGHDGTDFRELAGIHAGVNGATGPGDVPGRISLLTTPDGSSTLSERLRINNSGTITGTGSLGAWTNYSVTITGGWTLGNGTAVGKYTRLGKIVDFRVTLTFGSTSTFGASGDGLKVNFPLTPTHTGFAYSGRANDVSSGVGYQIAGIDIGSSVLQAFALTLGSGGLGGVTNSVPFTWANGDSLTINGTYETSD